MAIAKIKERTAGSVDAFEHDEMLQVWVIHHLQVIGEAARGISPGVKERCPEVQWPQIVALRNILVHEYFGLDLHQVWTMAQEDLPELEKQIQRIRAEVAADPPRIGWDATHGSRGTARLFLLGPAPANTPGWVTRFPRRRPRSFPLSAGPQPAHGQA